MFRQKIIFILLLALIFVVPTGFAQPRNPTDTIKPLSQLPTHQIIIQFKIDSSLNRQIQNAETVDMMQSLSTAAGVTLTYQREMATGSHVIALPDKMSLDEVIRITARLESLPDVEYAEPDRLLQVIGERLGEPFSIEATPNDPLYTDQWHYRYSAGVSEGINAPTAWDTTIGSPSVVVAVIDTGILPTHPDLANQIVQGYDFISDTFVANDGGGRDNDPSDPGDWVEGNNTCFAGSTPSDSSWHGSHVAGTIGADSNNGTGVAGVSWESKILPIRALGRCGGFTSDIADGIIWAAGGSVSGVPTNSNPAQVINMSLGGTGSCSSTEQSAINQAVNLGATIVVAAGNSAQDASNFSPGNCQNVINVASNDRTGDIAFYSNFSTTLIDVSAPGGETNATDSNGVLSTVDSSATSPSSAAYAYYQGTSMAAPHVAGVAALMYALNSSITPAEVEQLLKDTARDFPAGSSCIGFGDCGEGIVDATAAVAAACPTESISVTPATGTFTVYLPLITRSC
ncbi:MAG: S8 family serine peptidase [Chloroflexota bacterium]